MEQFEISVSYNNQDHHFDIHDYMQHSGVQCKYEVYKNNRFIVSFEPGPHKRLGICKNAGIEEEALLQQIARQLESYRI